MAAQTAEPPKRVWVRVRDGVRVRVRRARASSFGDLRSDVTDAADVEVAMLLQEDN